MVADGRDYRRLANGLVAEFGAYLGSQSKKAHTIRNYLSDIGGLLRDRPEEILQPGVDLGPVLVERLNSGNYKPSTSNRKASAAKSFFGFLRDKGYPVSLSCLPRFRARLGQRHENPITVEQFRQLIDSADSSFTGVRSRAIFSLMRNTGLIGDYVSDMVYLDFLFSENGRKEAVKSERKGRGRILAITDQTADFLDAYEEAWKGERGTDIKDYPEEPYFRNRFGEGLSGRQIRRDFAEQLSIAGLPPMTTMSLRYAFAKDVIDSGQDLADALGIDILTVYQMERNLGVRPEAQPRRVSSAPKPLDRLVVKTKETYSVVAGIERYVFKKPEDADACAIRLLKEGKRPKVFTGDKNIDPVGWKI